MILCFFWKEISSTLQERAWFHSSNHITLVNYLDSMGSLWRNMFTRTRKNAGNKEYASLFMKTHGVHKVGWQGSLSLVFVINNEIHLNSKIREFEGVCKGCVAHTIACRGRRGSWGNSEVVMLNQSFGHPSLSSICPDLQHAGSSMLCIMYGGEILNWVCIWWP